jgi:hypothetical protein
MEKHRAWNIDRDRHWQKSIKCGSTFYLIIYLPMDSHIWQLGKYVGNLYGSYENIINSKIPLFEELFFCNYKLDSLKYLQLCTSNLGSVMFFASQIREWLLRFISRPASLIRLAAIVFIRILVRWWRVCVLNHLQVYLANQATNQGYHIFLDIIIQMGQITPYILPLNYQTVKTYS